MQETSIKSSKQKISKSLNEKPIYILGPCSAEDRDQVVNTAVDLARRFPNAIYRSGIWKPRTRPGNFEGIGEKGLKWLREAGDLSGLPVATEVANAEHVELALSNDIDILWVGARTTVNPFYVQEIAEALKGVDIPVMIKNPLAPDFSLWLGAIERFEKIGIEHVIAIHRGFYNFDSKPYRNSPQWEIPIQLMANRSDIPIICDISHIGGSPELLPLLAQKAMDLNMSGLHVEVHPRPSEALSDAMQQITIKELATLIDGIQWREPSTSDVDFKEGLQDLRNKIDQVDQQILSDFFNRMQTIARIGSLKKQNKVTILQVKRWKKIEAHYLKEGMALGLNKEFLQNILHLIHEESMRIQHEIMNE
ncbi:MAG: chorismate mutase [Vicingaceae bacterium]